MWVGEAPDLGALWPDGPNALWLGAYVACAVPLPRGWVLPGPERSPCPGAECSYGFAVPMPQGWVLPS